MKNIFSIFAIAILFGSCSLFQPAGDKPLEDRELGVKVGDLALNIRLDDPNGRERQLHDLKGKMVLVDFWASWCGPCRASNPLITSAYRNYKNKSFKNGEGFTVYSVSMDKDRNSWLKAIEKDELIWADHVSDLEMWDSYVVPLYELTAIPHNVLIDGNGVILKTDVEAHKLESVLKKYVR